MMRRTVAIGALLGIVTGCATANDASQWPARYHKAGVTPQQLTENGAACLGAPASPWTATASGVGGGGIGPLVDDNRMVDLDPHTECMKATGYTVTPSSSSA